MKAELLFGYRRLDLGDDQQAFVATAEKALLDIVHLHPGGGENYLRELRLDYEALDADALAAFAAQSASPKLVRAAARIRQLAREAPDYDTL